ncbi:MAG: DUF2147 domain-containing protein [Chitinophagales bacterium]
MKNLFFTYLTLLSAFSSIAQSSTDIIGMWQNEDGNQQIEIYQQEDNLFYARLIWLKDNVSPYNQSAYDVENNEKSLQSRLLIDIDVLIGFEYLEEKHLWKNGKIYNFKNGNSYNGKIQIKEGELHLTGFYGILFFLGKTQKWTRYTAK